MKFSKAIALAAIVVVLAFCSGLVAVQGEKNDRPTYVYLKASDSPDGYATVWTGEDDKLDILMLCDPQIDTSSKYSVIGGSNDKTFLFVEKLLQATSPELVIINGDLVMSTLPTNQGLMLKYADILDARKIPWTITFGNHDCENFWTVDGIYEGRGLYDYFFGQVSKERIIELYSGYEYCLLSQGDCEEGSGNNFINVRDSKDQIIYTICTLDTLYLEDDDYHRYPTQTQVDWYESNIKKVSDLRYGADRATEQVVPSLVYTHVPVPEFKSAWTAAWNDGSPTSAYHYGNWADGNYNDMQDNEDYTFWSKAKELGSTKAMFFAHFHDNDFSVDYEGIRITFGQHSGMSHTYRVNRLDDTYRRWDYTALDLYGDKRGGTMCTVKQDGFEIAPIYATEVMPEEYAAMAIDYDALYNELIADGQTVIRAD